METTAKEVRFDKYCKHCKYKDNTEEDYPCYLCLDIGGRPYSHKPMYYSGEYLWDGDINSNERQ